MTKHGYTGLKFNEADEIAVKQTPPPAGEKSDSSRFYFSDTVIYFYSQLISKFNTPHQTHIIDPIRLECLKFKRISPKEFLEDLGISEGDIIVTPICNLLRAHWTAYVFRVEKKITLFHMDSLRKEKRNDNDKQESNLIKEIAEFCEILVGGKGQRIKLIRPSMFSQLNGYDCGYLTVINMAFAVVQPKLLDVNRRRLNLKFLYTQQYVDQVQKHMIKLFQESKQQNQTEMVSKLSEFQRLFELQLISVTNQPMMPWGGADDKEIRLRRYLVMSRVTSCSNTISLEDTVGFLNDLERLVTEFAVLSSRLKNLPEGDQLMLLELVESDI